MVEIPPFMRWPGISRTLRCLAFGMSVGFCLGVTASSGAKEPHPRAGKSVFVTRKPEPWTQKQKSADERGENPCNTQDPGFGTFEPWSRDVSMGQLLAPKARRRVYDVMIHFHGHEPARKEWVRVMDGTVLVGIDLGVSSGPYQRAFSDGSAFPNLLGSIARALEKVSPGARLGRVGLSAWSAGYGAVRAILSEPENQKRIDVVVLLDGLHCDYSGRSLDEAKLRPFSRFAALSASGKKLMVVTHSSIIPPGYASTTETANYLVHALGGKPQRTRPRAGDPAGLELISRYSRGAFHVRGFAGNDKLDHCAHLSLYRDILKVHVKPRWSAARAGR